MLAPPAPRGRGDPLHLAPHARDRGAGRHGFGVPQRPPHRDLRQGRARRRRDRAADDRARDLRAVPAQARPRRAQAAAGGRRPRLGGPAAGRDPSRSARARSSASAASTARARRSCCSPCSACCAASTGDVRIDGKRDAASSPAAGQGPAHAASRWCRRTARPKA